MKRKVWLRKIIFTISVGLLPLFPTLSQSLILKPLDKYSPANCTPSALTGEYYITLDSAEPLTNEKDAFWVSVKNEGKYPISDFLKIEQGQEVQIARCLPPGRWAVVGRGFISETNGTMLEGKIIQTNSIPSTTRASFLFNRPMAGDYVFPLYKSVQKVQNIYPKSTYAIHDLFEQNSDGSYNVSLSDRGAEEIEKTVKRLAQARGKILVEGFINQLGDSEEKRLESLIRAQAVASYIRMTFSLSEEQIQAIGIGSEGMQLGMQEFIKGKEKPEEGIVIRLMPH